MTDSVLSSTAQPTPDEGGPLPKQKRKYTRKTKAPVLSNNPQMPPPPVVPLPTTAPEPAAAAAAPEPAPVVPKTARRKRQPSTVKVVLTGNFKGFHALDPSIKFFPGIPVTVPNDGWIKAQLDAKYLKKV